MKTAFNSNSGFSGYTMLETEEIVKVLSLAGMDGIELNAEIFWGPKNRHAGLDIPDEEIIKTKEICDHYGLAVSSIMAHFSFISPDACEREKAIQEYKRCIDQAVMLETKVVHGYSGSPVKAVSDEEEQELWKVFKRGCIEILDYACDKGIDFGIEAVITHLVNGYESVKKMFEIIDRDDLYLNLDPCHLYMSEPANGHLNVIDEFGKKIKHVHVHDAVGMGSFSWQKFKKTGEATWENMRPFDLGEIDWVDIIRRLKKKEFAGFLSFDYGPGGGYLPGYKFFVEIVAKTYNNSMKQIINQVSEH